MRPKEAHEMAIEIFPKRGTVYFYNAVTGAVTRPKGANGLANYVDPDQTA